MPGGKICSAATCKSNSKKLKEKGEKVLFFRFPKDPQLCEEWVRKCIRKASFSPENKRICSLHFSPEDYEDEMKARLFGTHPRILKKTAIPSLLLPDLTEVHEIPSYQLKINEREEQKTIVEESLSKRESDIEVCHLGLQHSVSEQISESPRESPYQKYNDLKQRCEALTKENEYLKIELQKNEEISKQRCEALTKENECLKIELQKNEENSEILERKISQLELNLKECNLLFEDRAKEVFKDIFTPNQIDIILRKKSRAKWNSEELSKAFTLRYLGKRSYIYLRETLKFPLPGISTLHKWAANINLRSGVLHDVLNIMEMVGRHKNDFERTAVLSFDEMKVSSVYEYDQKQDEVVGPYSYIHIIMARGLFDQWKQPVYIGFDEKMSKKLLNSVIAKLYAIKYNVVACVSDCGTGNQGLWKELGVDINTTCYDHPITKEPIYFFADVPHLLKLIRNWFVDTGFTLEDGTVINKKPVDALITSSSAEISSCHKLTSFHLSCSKTERQNVRLAATLLSNTTATALQFYMPGNDKILAQNVGKFIELVNNWFDLMNSYTPSANVPSKKPYGLHLENQNKVLEDMKMVVFGLRCTGKRSMQVFQKGIIMSINSLQNLFLYMREKFESTFIITHRLNQDCLENLFSQVRTRGGLHDHPSPLDTLYRIRLLILGKNPGIVQTHSNVVNLDSETEYLLAMALKQANIENIEPQRPLTKEDYFIDKSGGDASSTTSSCTSSSSASIAVRQQNIFEKDGLVYIAGYIAKQHLQTYPHLGQHTYKGEVMNIHSYSVPSWIQSLSFGGLIQPSQEWSAQVKELEKYFNKYHKETINKVKHIVKRTFQFISKKVQTLNIPNDLIHSFCRLRLFVRIKFLNKKKKEPTLLGKRFHSGGLEAMNKEKIVKKMKKIIN